VGYIYFSSSNGRLFEVKQQKQTNKQTNKCEVKQQKQTDQQQFKYNKPIAKSLKIPKGGNQKP
jgi:hypothetical protein